MEIKGANGLDFADNADRRNSEKGRQGKALTVASTPSGAADHGASRANPNRRNSAFLAHLSLQYADKGTRNRLIVERRAAAMTAYASDRPSDTSSRAGTRGGVKA